MTAPARSEKLDVSKVVPNLDARSATVATFEAKPSTKQKKVLAVASAGGHWVQLQRLLPALANCNVVYVSTKPDLLPMAIKRKRAPKFYTVVDANARTVFRVFVLFSQVLRIMIKERPPVVISTGAAPGCLAIALGKLLGAKTIWIDSIANSEKLSLSGRLVSPLADVWLTQWEDLCADSFLGRKPEFAGNVL